MRRTFRYLTLDVFTTRQFEGNQLAVFPDAAGLDSATMQKIARELNLAETVFIAPASSSAYAARLQIFTPLREMDFAGHPTIGAASVIGRGDRFVLELRVGPVPIRAEDGRYWLLTPPIHERETFTREECAAALGVAVDDLLDIAPQLLDAGNRTLIIPMRDKGAVDRAWLDLRGARDLHGSRPPMCVLVFTPTPEGAYTRMFAPEYGVPEDAATGSSTGPLALYMLRHELARGTRFLSEQGTKMGRRSILHINVQGDGIEIGGDVTPVAEAAMTIDQA